MLDSCAYLFVIRLAACTVTLLNIHSHRQSFLSQLKRLDYNRQQILAVMPGFLGTFHTWYQTHALKCPTHPTYFFFSLEKTVCGFIRNKWLHHTATTSGKACWMSGLEEKYSKKQFLWLSWKSKGCLICTSQNSVNIT